MQIHDCIAKDYRLLTMKNTTMHIMRLIKWLVLVFDVNQRLLIALYSVLTI